MKLRYAYHSEHNADKQDRWIHFVLFVGALLLLLAASQQLFLHFTAWHAADEAHNWNHLILGIVYLLIAGLLTFIGLRLKNNSQGDADRYVRIGEEDITWHLNQKETENRVVLADIASFNQPNVRDLVLTLKDGNSVVLPIYLIANEEKQEELTDVLHSLK